MWQKKLLAFIVIANQVLAMYGIGLSSISVLDICLFLIIITSVFKFIFTKKIDFNRTIILLIIPTILSYILVFSSKNDMTFHLRSFKYIFYLVSIGIIAPKTSLKDLLVIYRVLVLAACVFLCFQYFSLLVFNFYPKGYLEGIPLLREELSSHSEITSYESWFRPRSFFGEPSQFGIFVGSYLAILVTLKKKFTKSSYFIAFSLLLSFSGTAYTLLALSLALYIVKTSKKFSMLIITGSLIPIAVLLITQNNFGPQFVKRLTRRTEGLIELNEKLDVLNFIFGNGMIGRIDFNNWANSITLYFYYFGLIGISFLFLFLLIQFRQKYSLNSTIILLIMSLSIGTEFLISQQILLLFPILLKANENSLV